MATIVKYAKVFVIGTITVGLTMALCGFLGFGLIGALLQYFGQHEALPIALGGAMAFGLLGVLSGGLISILDQYRIKSSQDEPGL